MFQVFQLCFWFCCHIFVFHVVSITVKFFSAVLMFFVRFCLLFLWLFSLFYFGFCWGFFCLLFVMFLVLLLRCCMFAVLGHVSKFAEVSVFLIWWWGFGFCCQLFFPCHLPLLIRFMVFFLGFAGVLVYMGFCCHISDLLSCFSFCWCIYKFSLMFLVLLLCLEEEEALQHSEILFFIQHSPSSWVFSVCWFDYYFYYFLHYPSQQAIHVEYYVLSIVTTSHI